MGFVIPTQRIPPPKPHRDLVHDHDWFVQVNERATPQDWPQDVIDEVAREIAEAALPSPEAAARDYRVMPDNTDRDAAIRSRYVAGGVTHRDLAETHGVSAARIGQILRESDIAPPFRTRNTDRDAEIYRRYTEGRITQGELADEYGVSGPRISQIITREHNRRVSS